MDLKTVRTYLSYGNDETIEKLRKLIRSFTEEEIIKLKTNKLKMTLHLVGTAEQQGEDLKYFREIADSEVINMSYDDKRRAVILGEIEPC